MPEVDKLVVVDWPRGKHGHVTLEGLPDGVEVAKFHITVRVESPDMDVPTGAECG